jgi:hypothetical protein
MQQCGGSKTLMRSIGSVRTWILLEGEFTAYRFCGGTHPILKIPTESRQCWGDIGTRMQYPHPRTSWRHTIDTRCIGSWIIMDGLIGLSCGQRGERWYFEADLYRMFAVLTTWQDVSVFENSICLRQCCRDMVACVEDLNLNTQIIVLLRRQGTWSIRERDVKADSCLGGIDGSQF